MAKRSVSLCFAIGVGALFIASGIPAQARSFHAAGARDPAYGDAPDIPDRSGCVKWCFRDTNPCDPPEFKRADGRCEDY